MPEDATALRGVALETSLLERTKALHPLLNEQAPLAEAQGRLTDATIHALAKAGLFGFYMPRCFGGSELWPLEALEVIEALSYGDASTAWVAMALQVAGGTAAAYLVPSAAKEIFGEEIPTYRGARCAVRTRRHGARGLSPKWPLRVRQRRPAFLLAPHRRPRV